MCRHVATALALLLVALWFGEIDAKDKPATIDVRVDEIGESVRLIGRLGVPLEQMITAEGVWQYPPGITKDGSLIFSVSSVDGKPLEKPMEFYRARVDAIEKRKSVSPKEGERWTLRCFETGDYHGYQGAIPEEYFRESGKLSPEQEQSPVWRRPFTTKLVGILRSRMER